MENLLRLGDILTERGISREDFANDIGLSREMVSKYCSGKAFPHGKTLAFMADALSLNPGDLFRKTIPDPDHFENTFTITVKNEGTGDVKEVIRFKGSIL